MAARSTPWIVAALLLAVAPGGGSARAADAAHDAVPLFPEAFEAWCLDLDSGTGPNSGPASLGPSIGTRIDAYEREKYHLLPGLDGFTGARLEAGADGRITLSYDCRREAAELSGHLRLDPLALRLTRFHVWLTDLYFARLRLTPPIPDGPSAQRHTALRMAAIARYDLAEPILRDLRDHFAETEAAAWAARLLPGVERLLADRRALIWDQTAGLGSGSNDLRLFGGYYGLWLGIAVPMALGADSPEPYGIGLILGGPGGFWLADRAARRTPIDEGRATMLSLGANLGTWQGLGWAAYADADDRAVVTSGLVCGLAGLAAAISLSGHHDFSEGHAALTESAMNWGAWYGVVVSGMTESDDDDALRNILLGSALAVGATGVAARDVRMTERDVRIISLKEIVGSVMGLGVVLIARPDQSYVGWGLIGVGGLTGLVKGYRDVDQGEAVLQARRCDDRPPRAAGLPRPTLYADRTCGGRLLPALAWTFGF